MKNQCPISLENIDYKIVSKGLAAQLKKMLPSLIMHQQNRCISETGRLIPDILEIADTLNLIQQCYLVTIDTENSFESYLLNLVESYLSCGSPNKIWFWSSFLEKIEVLLKNQESCVINACTAIPYFKLQKEAHQGGPISTYLFTVALEILLYLIKTNNKILVLNICYYSFLYSAYADDITFFLRKFHLSQKLLL